MFCIINSKVHWPYDLWIDQILCPEVHFFKFSCELHVATIQAWLCGLLGKCFHCLTVQINLSMK